MEYLDYKVTKQEDSVENLFCKILDKKGKKVPMDETESLFMMKLLLTQKEEDLDSVYKKLNELCFYLPVLRTRIATLGYTVDKKTEMTIAIIAGNVGTAVMYVYYLAYKAKEAKIKNITFEYICETIFPFGFFDKKSISEIWDMQKVSRKTPEERGSDNLLDYETASKSLISK